MTDREPQDVLGYRSASDLPSFLEMRDQLKAMKVLTRFIARDQRKGVIELEAELRILAALVDRFYRLLGPRNWIFHERLNTEKIATLTDHDVEQAERKLIEIYQDPASLQVMIRYLNAHPDLRSRMHLIDNARVDYEAGRYYSTVLVLLTVMDGFVNDCEAPRRGLHTRDADEMNAWDSVVGHHLGLSNAHKTFTKSTFKKSAEPLFELQRHGIIHGTLLNFDNVVVATKAWNRLFAVADWATSRRKQMEEPPAQVGLRELCTQIAENAKAKEALDAWQPRTVDAHDREFALDEITARATSYLDAWISKNYGAMASLLAPDVAKATRSQTAGMIRSEYEGYALEGYEMTRLDFEAAAICEVAVVLTLDSGAAPARLRWIRMTADGKPATSNQAGNWMLFLWNPLTMLRRAAEPA